MISRPTQPATAPEGTLFALRPVEIARAAGEVAANRCEAAAEKRGWDSTGASAFVLALIKRQGPCSGEFCVNQAKAAGFQPHDDRAYGAVFQSLVRKRLIRCTGFGMRAKGRGTAGARMWECVA